MFLITNNSGATQGPFGHASQLGINNEAELEITDSMIPDFIHDQNLRVALQSNLIKLRVGQTEYGGQAAIGYLDSIALVTIQMLNQTSDYRSIMAVNRFPAGYTVYPTGAGDDIINKVYGAGPELVMASGSLTKELQLLNHFYVFGGRAIWEAASLNDKMNAWLVAPASTGWLDEAGNFNKVQVAPGAYVLVPASQGQGNCNVDLAAKFGTTSVLKSTPVPVPGNVGWFDYDSDTNVLTPNVNQKGGYNLYSFDVKLFQFCNKVPGRKGDGSESVFESSDVVGKLLYNTWRIRFTLTLGEGSSAKAGIILTAGVKINSAG